MQEFSIEYGNEVLEGVAWETKNGLLNPKTIIMDHPIGDLVNEFQLEEDFFQWADQITEVMNQSGLFDGEVHVAYIC